MNAWPGTAIGQKVRAKIDISDVDPHGKIYFHAHVGDYGVIHHIDMGKGDYYPTVKWGNEKIGFSYYDCTPDEIELVD